MAEKPIVGALVSDLHCGSRWGLWPDGMEMVGGQPWNLNKGQRYLLECWQDFQGWLPKKLDFLLICGDTTDGQAKADMGKYQVSTHGSDQAAAAISLLKPLAERASLTYCVMGSRYHQESEICEGIAMAIGAQRHPNGFYSPALWTISLGGIMLETWHKLSDAQIYTAQAMQREIMFDRMVSDVKGYQSNLIVVGHWHSLRDYGDPDTTVLTVPCWELQVPWALQKPNLWLPHIGGLLVEIWPGRKELGEKVVDWRFKRFRLPKREVSHVEIGGEGKRRHATAANIQLGGTGQGN